MDSLETILIDPKKRQAFSAILRDKLNELFGETGYDYIREIDKQFNKLSPDSRKIFETEIKPLYWLLKWRCLNRLGQGQVLDLAENHLIISKQLVQLDEHVLDFSSIIRGYLYSFSELSERDNFKILLRQALLNNKEVFTSDLPIKTINEWFKNIIGEAGLYLADSLKENEYYLRNENFNRLSAVDKEFLKSVFNLYKFCYYSSDTPEGLEEPIIFTDDDDKVKILYQGAIEDPASKLPAEVLNIIKTWDTSTTPEISPAATNAQYQTLTRRYKQILSNLIKPDQLASVKLNVINPDDLTQILDDALTAKDYLRVIVIFTRLIEAKKLENLLTTSDFQGIFKKYLSDEFESDLLDPTELTPEIFSVMCEFIFINQLKYNSEDAGVLTLHFANLLAKQGARQYLSVVYGDAESKKFDWRRIELVGNDLKFV
jgi:hypothetical protein